MPSLFLRVGGCITIVVMIVTLSRMLDVSFQHMGACVHLRLTKKECMLWFLHALFICFAWRQAGKRVEHWMNDDGAWLREGVEERVLHIFPHPGYFSYILRLHNHSFTAPYL